MPDTQKIEQRAQGVVHHEYRRGLGDLMLEAGKAFIRNPEARHHLLAAYAALTDSIPLRSRPHRCARGGSRDRTPAFLCGIR